MLIRKILFSYRKSQTPLFNGTKNPEILRKYSGISDDDLNYYREHKLEEKLSKSKELKDLAEQIETAEGDTYLALVVGLQKRALDALELQDASTDPKAWAMVSREARGYVELLGRALDRIRDQPQINFNQISIYNSPEWLAVGAINRACRLGQAEEAARQGIKFIYR